MLEYLYGKMFGSKIAWANKKDGDRVVAGTRPSPVTIPPIGAGYFRAKPFLV
jgi:hypothetical protein